jgi:hypothetical protein
MLLFRYQTRSLLKAITKTYKYPTKKRLLIFFPAGDFFGQNSTGNTGSYFLHVTFSNSPQTKNNGYFVTVSKGLSQIVPNYVGIKCQDDDCDVHLLYFFIAGGTAGQPAGGDGDRPRPEEAKA